MNNTVELHTNGLIMLDPSILVYSKLLLLSQTSSSLLRVTRCCLLIILRLRLGVHVLSNRYLLHVHIKQQHQHQT